MKKLIFIFAFSCLCSAAFAQYGRLEPLREGDTIYSVLRTPKESLLKLKGDPDKNTKKKADVIERVERQLEFVRGGYVSNRIPTMNVASFTNSIKWLQNQGINVQYYLEEFFIYYPRTGQRPDKEGKAY